MNYQIEIQRHGVTLSAFLNYCKASCQKKDIPFEISKDEFSNPPQSIETHYFIKDGKKICFNNDYRSEWPADEAPCQSEIFRQKPLDYQVYMLNFDGSCYNEICEFSYDDEKTGHGYYFQLNKE